MNEEFTNLHISLLVINGEDYELCKFMYNFPDSTQYQKELQEMSKPCAKLIPEYVCCKSKEECFIEVYCQIYKSPFKIGFKYQVSNQRYKLLCQIFEENPKVITNPNRCFALFAIKDLIKDYLPLCPIKVE